MAGHRKGRTLRGQARQQRMRRRLSSATTAEEQLAAAYDWFRSAARRSDAARRARVMREASEFLARLAGQLSGEA
jgi:hypothetical protein